MYQSWGSLLFLHWPVAAALLRPLIPERLHIDTFEGTAWIGITPFTMWGVRPVLLPAMPLLSKTHELNVRTYVYCNGVPGVWFLSLDASNPLVVVGARLAFHLPYFQARMRLEEREHTRHFTSHRTRSDTPRADFEAVWTPGTTLPQAQPDSLEFFLTERYCLYTAWRERLYRTRIFHTTWSLSRAALLSYSSTMLESHGLPPPGGEPLLHHQAVPLRVAVWPLHEVGVSAG
jgi:uncharacterized protein YqjF (DUF2071 family)